MGDSSDTDERLRTARDRSDIVTDRLERRTVSRRQTESFDSQMSRLRDLSPNDVAAIAAALDRIASLTKQMETLHRKASHGCYDFNCPECDRIDE